MTAELMRRWIAGAVLGLLLAGGTRLNAEGENRDPKAVEVARTMMQAMGGKTPGTLFISSVLISR